MRDLLLLAALALPGAAFAAGSGDSAPPEPTETTTTCTDGMVWSDAKQKCVAPEDSMLDPGILYQAIRELAYAGRYDDTLRVLAAMPDQNDGRVLTYRGFVHRMTGDADLAMSYYRQAIDADPDNILARSYMGQGLAAEGRSYEAYVQLTEIRARGGTGTWAETALRRAIETGHSIAY